MAALDKQQDIIREICRPPRDTLDEHRGEIFRLRFAEDMSLEKIINVLSKRDIRATKGQYKEKIGHWNYGKNTTFRQALEWLPLVDEARVRGVQASQAHRDAPTNHVEAAERYWRQHPAEFRTLYPLTKQQNLSQGYAQPSPLGLWLMPPTPLRMPAQVLYDTENMIQKALRLGTWKWENNECLIWSSSTDAKQKQAIMSMIHGVDMMINCRNHNPQAIRGHSDAVLAAIPHLVNGDYHDNIPNILIKINDLYDYGLRDEAQEMKDRVARAVYVERGSNESKPAYAIYKALKEVELEQLAELEERCLILFRDYFVQCLGPCCFGSFVTLINLARRKLARDPHARFEDWLPDINVLDKRYGEINSRSLDVIRIRAETYYIRESRQAIPMREEEGYAARTRTYLMLNETRELVYRAYRIVGDAWQQNYFLVKGYYYMAMAQTWMGYHKDAEQSLRLVLQYVEAFKQVDRSGQFDGEVLNAREMLKWLPEEHARLHRAKATTSSLSFHGFTTAPWPCEVVDFGLEGDESSETGYSLGFNATADTDIWLSSEGVEDTELERMLGYNEEVAGIRLRPLNEYPANDFPESYVWIAEL